jgi:beta-lactamase superfamily II metal-dependent hydrolase
VVVRVVIISGILNAQKTEKKDTFDSEKIIFIEILNFDVFFKSKPMRQFSISLKSVFLPFVLFISITGNSQPENQTFPNWKAGEMEIHHIYTGRGECVFCIFPDGTNMLIDAGDTGPHRDPRKTHGSPDETRQPGEWIARYISRLLDYRDEKKIDYAYLTHFHSDHMGRAFPTSPKTKNGGDYVLSGLSEVAEYLPFKTLIDRDWPTYQFPVPQKGNTFENYKTFIDWSIENNGMKMERFQPGSNEQFSLLFQAEKYPEFEIRNIIANGKIWTGKKNKTKNLFPKDADVDENKSSSGIRISYGNFDYFNGGDINGRITMNTPKWKDVETPVGKVLGPIEVCEVNHHAWVDAMNENFVASTQAQVFIMQVGNVSHINLSTLRTMTSKELYPSDRHIIPTNIPEISKIYLGESRLKQLSGDGGHAVIKVTQGGNDFKVFLLTTENESMQVKSVFGPFECK